MMKVVKTLAVALCVLQLGTAQERSRVTLDQAVAQALAHHPSLLRSQENRLELESTRQTAESRLYPQISLEAIAKDGPSSAPNLNALGLVNSILTRNVGASFVLSQTILDSGFRYHTILSRQHEVEAAQRLQELERARVVLGVYRAYYQALLSESLVLQSERDLDLRQATLKLADTRFRKGLTARVDVALAEMQAQEAQVVRLESLTFRQVAYSDLQRAQGLDQPVDYLVEEPAAGSPGADLSPDLEQRPEITSLDQQILARQQAAQAAQSEFGASLRFLASAGTLRVAPENQTANHIYAVGLALTIPLFDGGASEGNSQQQLHRAAALQAARQELLQTLRNQLERARANLALQTDLEGLRQKQREQARYLASSALLRYRNGLTPMLEVFQAQRLLTEADRTALSAHHNRLAAEAEYRFAAGGELPW
jgi:outer membrane protein TolC